MNEHSNGPRSGGDDRGPYFRQPESPYGGWQESDSDAAIGQAPGGTPRSVYGSAPADASVPGSGPAETAGTGPTSPSAWGQSNAVPSSGYREQSSGQSAVPSDRDTGVPPVYTSSQSTGLNPAGTGGRRGIGLGTALGLMLVGAIVAGSIVGFAANQFGSTSGSTESATEALSQQPNDVSAPAEGGVAEVADAVLPAVVSIQVGTPTAAGEGSGSIITPDGYVLTNHHVVAGAEDGAVQVSLHNGDTRKADVVASDPNTDIGIIKIHDVDNLPTLEFGDSDQLVVGQEVIAIGAPLGLSGTVTSGIVSAVERPVRAAQDGGESSLIDAIQTDAAINPGNSGGPLVDMDGNLVGMNSVIASLSQGDAAGSIGLGFAIPSNFAQRVSQQLIEDGEASQPMLGVSVDARNPVDGGAMVVSVEPGSPAEEAGIKKGEVITRVNERGIDTSDALITAVRSHDFGEVVTLEVLDPETEETREVEATLTSE